jgi:hypothetical protein
MHKVLRGVTARYAITPLFGLNWARKFRPNQKLGFQRFLYQSIANRQPDR